MLFLMYLDWDNLMILLLGTTFLSGLLVGLLKGDLAPSPIFLGLYKGCCLENNYFVEDYFVISKWGKFNGEGWWLWHYDCFYY